MVPIWEQRGRDSSSAPALAKGEALDVARGSPLQGMVWGACAADGDADGCAAAALEGQLGVGLTVRSRSFGRRVVERHVVGAVSIKA